MTKTRSVVCLLLLAASSLCAQAIITTGGGGNAAVVFPAPTVGLPTPAENTVTGIPAGAKPQGVAYCGSDCALVADAGNHRVFVVTPSTASVSATIATPTYDGNGTIAVDPTLEFALAADDTGALTRITAPFNASSAQLSLTAGRRDAPRTENIVFNTNPLSARFRRAFIASWSGVAVLDPPYDAILFTIPGSCEGVALTPDGNTLLTTSGIDMVNIYTAPFSTSSAPVKLKISGGTREYLSGIKPTPDGSTVLVVDGNNAAVYAVHAPYNATSSVQTLPIPAGFPTGGFQDVDVSSDGELAIATGGASTGTAPALFIHATPTGASSFGVNVPGGRGTGAARFLPGALLPGPTITAAAPASVTPGATLTYTLTYGNTSTAAATNVIIQNILPGGATFLSATNGGTFSNNSGIPIVTWNLGTLNAGAANQTVSFTVNVTSGVGTVVTNRSIAISADGFALRGARQVTTAVNNAPSRRRAVQH